MERKYMIMLLFISFVQIGRKDTKSPEYVQGILGCDFRFCPELIIFAATKINKDVLFRNGVNKRSLGLGICGGGARMQPVEVVSHVPSL